VSAIPTFKPKLIPLFFVHIPYKNLQIGPYCPNFPMAPLLSFTSIKSGGESSHERQLMVANCEGEFDQDVLAFGSSFKIEYDQLIEIKKMPKNVLRFE